MLPAEVSQHKSAMMQHRRIAWACHHHIPYHATKLMPPVDGALGMFTGMQAPRMVVPGRRVGVGLLLHKVAAGLTRDPSERPLAVRMTFAFCLASARQIAKPSPEFPPVTNAVLPATLHQDECDVHAWLHPSIEVTHPTIGESDDRDDLGIKPSSSLGKASPAVYL